MHSNSVITAIRTRARPAFGAFLAAIVLCAAVPAFATMPDGFNHPELRWQVIETDHFRVIFHQGGERLAQRTAQIAEEIYPQVTADLGQTPGTRTPIILASYADDARYFAVREEKRIFLSAPALNEARVHGEEYLRALLVHEFTHIVTYWATRGWLWDQGEYAGAGLMPAWFVEGLAQAEAYTFNLYGGFLVLRSAALEDAYTPLAKIDADQPTDRVDTWLTYAQGYSMVSYISDKFGKEALAKTLDNFALYRDFDYALHHAIGLTQRQLFDVWQSEMRDHYRDAAEGKSDPSPVVDLPLEAVLSARVSPHGDRIALLGVEDWHLADPYPLLYVADATGANLRPIAGNVGLFSSAKFAWSPDNSTLYFTGKRILPNGTMRVGIYRVDVDNGQAELLTPDLRASDPDLSRDGAKLVFVVYQDDATLLATANPDGSQVNIITSADAPYQAFSPSWSPDGESIAFNCVWPNHSVIAVMRPDGSDFRTLTSGKSFDIEPRFSPTGSSIAYVSYAGGVPNVWVMKADGSQRWQVTDLAAASAFYPDWEADVGLLHFVALRTREASIAAADPDLSIGEALGPDEPAEFPSPSALAEYPVRPYSGLRNFRRYITRTINSGDGQGDTAGLLTEFADPLRQHDASLYTEYGLKSHRPRIELQYNNSQLYTDLSFRYLNDVTAPRAVDGVTVWDRRRAVALGARLPTNRTGDIYRRDTTTLTLSASDFEPIRTSATPVVPPLGGTVNGMTLIWRRSQRVPRERRESYALSVSSLGYALGGAVDANSGSVRGEWAWEAPDVRHQALLGVSYNIYDGEDLQQNPLRQESVSTTVAYQRRLADDLYLDLWPFAYSGPLTLTLSWERFGLLSGTAPGGDANTLRAELLNQGDLTRYAPYQLRTGVSYSDRDQDFTFYLRLTTTPLIQPLREDESLLPPCGQPAPHPIDTLSPAR